MSQRPSRARAAANRRIRVLVAAMVVLIGLMGARAAFLGVVRADELTDVAREAQRRETAIPAPRGAIVSSDKQMLAVDQLTATITASPYLIENPAAVARQIGPILRIPVAELVEKVSGEGQYALLASNVDQTRTRRIREMKIVGIHFADSYTRFFPYRDKAAQVIGLVGNEGEGQTGLEARHDDDLRGIAGTRLDARDARYDSTVNELARTDPKPGKTVTLTLNAGIQDKVMSILTETVETYGATGASAIVMNPKDGSIITMATVPSFDPNERKKTLTDQVLLNSAPTWRLYEPGSTFKVVTVAGALEDNVVTPTTLFTLEPTVTLFPNDPASRQTLGEAHRDTRVTYSTTEIIAESSNVGTYKIAEKLGEARVQEWIRRFGFGARTGIDSSEEIGLVRKDEDWSGTSILSIPIGQGITVTLAQMARAYAAIANGGQLVTPHLVRDVAGVTPARPVATQILSPETATQMNEMLKGVVSDNGTGTKAEVPGFEVAGKTGTTRKRNEETGQYEDRYVASFIGYLPADDPQLLIAVAVDEPTKTSFYGGDVAAPAFTRIATFSLQQLGINP